MGEQDAEASLWLCVGGRRKRDERSDPTNEFMLEEGQKMISLDQ